RIERHVLQTFMPLPFGVQNDEIELANILERHLEARDDDVVFRRYRAMDTAIARNTILAHTQAGLGQALWQRIGEDPAQTAAAGQLADAITEFDQRLQLPAAVAAAEQMLIELRFGSFIEFTEPVSEQSGRWNRRGEIGMAHGAASLLSMHSRRRPSPRWRITRTLPSEIPRSTATSLACRSS